jgi:hypothetical protein
MRKVGLVFVFASLSHFLAGGCKDGGCKNDNDCKGARVCENGACVEARSGAQPTQSHAPAPLGELPPTTQPAQPAQPAAACAACTTQEDFDAAQKMGRQCCPVTACRTDSECPTGRVCCRIPSGQLCADEERCKSVNRVASNARSTASFACGKTRCKAGQYCCPWGAVPCVSEMGMCDNDDAASKNAREVGDYAPFSNTSQGYGCNPRTGEPCAEGQRCNIGKVGRSPMTTTAACR